MQRSLNLDRNFMPTALPEIDYELLQFSGGEWHIKLEQNMNYSALEVVITTRIRNGDDIMKLAITVDALRLSGVTKIDLVMPYIPYARQDRQCYIGESFSLKVFANLINNLKFNKVLVLDSHSDVATALLDNCKNISNTEYVKQTVLNIGKELLIVSPDSGANKKINKLVSELVKDSSCSKLIIDTIKCDKVRDVSTGELTSFEILSKASLLGKPCLIIDDIADGGGTFIGIAQKLKEQGASNVYLFITHGIFSKGYSTLQTNISKCFCTNSFSDINDEYVKQFKIQL